MKDINAETDIYATDFGNLLTVIINDLMNSNFERKKNPNLQYQFILHSPLYKKLIRFDKLFLRYDCSFLKICLQQLRY